MTLRASLLAELPKVCAQSATLWIAGDAVCQGFEMSGRGKKEKKDDDDDAGACAEGFDFRRTGVNAIYGGAFVGPVGLFWRGDESIRASK